ncbi:unnamed protein product, partial [Discosporangium mesarthrocarpum]
TSGEEWIVSTGWRNGTIGVCEWDGITCDDGDNVTTVSLPANGLTGNLSDATGFFRLTTLKTLDLSYNRLTGPVPTGLGLMSALEVLDLSNNEFTGFPSTWGSEATSLMYLSLQYNNLSG